MRGYPDFFGFSTFLKFGALTWVTYGDVLVVPGATVTPLDFQMKGKLYSAMFEFLPWTWGLVDLDLSLSVDGGPAGSWSPFDLQAHNIVKAQDNWVHLTEINQEALRITCACSLEITFDSSFTVTFTNNTLFNCDVGARAYVARII